MAYHVYVNWTRKRASWHIDGCSAVEMHGGTAERANQQWFQCATLSDVQAILARHTAAFDRDQVRPCAKCNPDQSDRVE